MMSGMEGGKNKTGTSVVAFDFDGVFVADSDAVFKMEAWHIVLAPYAGRYEPLLEEGRKMFGSGKSGGRAEILRHVFRGLGVAETRIEEAARAFDTHVQARIAAAGVVPGAMEALAGLRNRGMALYLNSGTPTPALVKSASNLGIADFFREILGSTEEPVGGDKIHNLSYIMGKEGVGTEEILFVGDSASDAAAANECGCRFVGVSNRWNGWGEERPFPVVADLRDVERYL